MAAQQVPQFTPLSEQAEPSALASQLVGWHPYVEPKGPTTQAVPVGHGVALSGHMNERPIELVHAPPWQTYEVGQPLLQAPQFCESVLMSTQAPLQQTPSAP